MKSRYYEYAVYNSGRMLAGQVSFKVPVSPKKATERAAWEAQIAAQLEDDPFDYANFSIVVKPVSRMTKLNMNTYWEVLKS